MTGSQVIDAEEDRHKLVVEYKDALQPADLSQFQTAGHPLSTAYSHLEFDDRGDLTAASVTAELWGNFNCPVRVLGAGRYQSYFD